jgi:hypothetical protein
MLPVRPIPQISKCVVVYANGDTLGPISSNKLSGQEDTATTSWRSSDITSWQLNGWDAMAITGAALPDTNMVH